MRQGPHKKARQHVARRLKELREARKFTQEGLSAKAGFARTYVGVVESCKIAPTVDSIGRLCDALGIELSDLLNEKAK